MSKKPFRLSEYLLIIELESYDCDIRTFVSTVETIEDAYKKVKEEVPNRYSDYKDIRYTLFDLKSRICLYSSVQESFDGVLGSLHTLKGVDFLPEIKTSEQLVEEVRVEREIAEKERVRKEQERLAEQQKIAESHAVMKEKEQLKELMKKYPKIVKANQ